MRIFIHSLKCQQGKIMPLALACSLLVSPRLLATDIYVGPPSGGDDQPHIQDCLNQARDAGSANLIFDSNRLYILRSYNTNLWGCCNVYLVYQPTTSGHSMSVEGNGSTLLASEAGLTTLAFMKYWRDSTIKGLIFTNAHGYTTTSSAGLTIEDERWADGYQVTNNKVIGCTFASFSTAISIGGCSGISIISNSFLMPKGRDSGTGTNPVPNVGLRIGEDLAGSYQDYARSISILYNTYDGFSGSTDINTTTSRSCGDGFVYGGGRNFDVRYNTVTNFGAEAIVVFVANTNNVHQIETSGEGTTVAFNTIDNSRFGPMGYGIRADVPESLIFGNTITNVVYGLKTKCEAVSPPTLTNTLPCYRHIKFFQNKVSVGAGNPNLSASIPARAVDLQGASDTWIFGNDVTLLGNASTNGDNYAIMAGPGYLRPQPSGLRFFDNHFKAQNPSNGFTTIWLGHVQVTSPQHIFVGNVFDSLQYNQAKLAGYSDPTRLQSQITNVNTYLP